ncbi:hypothetical protein HMPREF9069_01871 [Atopobium sp. oral taxon 810 str. F0209]|nr:hypothetical protein HMPREF9069_01871 [Atopobium sp. oral taxon 810 str. F0209]
MRRIEFENQRIMNPLRKERSVDGMPAEERDLLEEMPAEERPASARVERKKDSAAFYYGVRKCNVVAKTLGYKNLRPSC